MPEKLERSPSQLLGDWSSSLSTNWVGSSLEVGEKSILLIAKVPGIKTGSPLKGLYWPGHTAPN